MNRAKRLLGVALVSAAIVAALLTPAVSSAVEEGEGRASWTIYSYPQVRWGTDDRTIYSFDFLVPLWQTEKDILFFNPKFSLDDQKGSEVNFGFGYRHLLFSDRLILGVNGYYDSRHTGWDTRHEQLGVGLEVMTDWVTGRFNGYFPVTGPRITTAAGLPGYYFRDVGIYTGGGTSSVEETLGGYDGELGFKIPGLSKYLETWVYAGGYHFEGDYVKDINGFSSRIEVVPTDFLRLGFEYRNDNLSGDQYFGEAAVTVPFSIDNLVAGKNPFEGIGKHFGGDRTLKERLTEPVRRDVDVRTFVSGGGTSTSSGTLVADVIFVSETGDDTTGDGSFENPFRSVGRAVTAIHSGGVYSGITTIHVMDEGGAYAGGGVVDIASLMIWGSGMPHPTYGVITNQYLTAPDLYQLDISASGVEVFGNTFVSPYGIASIGSGTSIHNNTFNGNIAMGVNIGGGSASIFDNVFTDNNQGIGNWGGTMTVTGNTFTGGTCGVFTGSGTSVVTGNNFSNIIAYGLYTYGGTLTASGNTIGSTINGVYTNGGMSTVAGNTITDSTYGVVCRYGGITITSNTIGTAANPITGTGIHLEDGAAPGDIYGNDIVVSGSGTVYGIESYVANLVLDDNDISVTSGGATAFGIYGYINTGDLLGSITGGSITAAGGSAYGVYLRAPGGSIGGPGSPFTISGAAINANASGGSAYGVDMRAYNNIYSSITGGTITANGYDYAYGIYSESISGSVGDSANPFTVSGATITTTVAAGNGYGVYLTGGTYTVTGNTFPSAYGSYTTGIYSAGGTLTATDNTFSNYYGLYQLFGSSTVSNNAFFNSGIVERTGALTVTGNSFTNSGILVYDGSAIIGTLAVGTGNTFAGGGGAISASGGYVSIIGNTIGTSENPLEVYGIYLGSGASLMDPIYWNDIIVNGTGPDAYGIYSETPNLSITDNTIRVTNPYGNAYGIYARNSETLSYPINTTEISVTGLSAYGIRLDGYRIGAPSGPYYMTMNYLVIDATATGGLGSRACGIDVSAGYAVQDFTMDWCQLNITAPSGDARGVSIIAATPYDDGPIAASLNHINATIDGGASRCFLYLSGDPGGGNGVGWSVNTYTPAGGPWSGNYDVGGYATPGPVWTNIPDAEISP